MNSILLPNSIKFEAGEEANSAIFTIEPLFYGYGTTIGNALRRVLLSSLEGAAVTAVKIKGVQHEFMPIKGVKEDALQVMLNLKLLRFTFHANEAVKLTLKADKEGNVTAKDFEKNADVEIVNPDQHIATITDASGSLEMEITVDRGRGYSPTEEREATGEIGLMSVDALFSPVRNVGLKVENTRVGEITNFDKVILDIQTDGSITPEEAVKRAVEILLDHYNLVFEHLGGNPAEAAAKKETEDPAEPDQATPEVEEKEESAEAEDES